MVRLRLKEIAILKRAYRMHRVHASERGIPFLLTFTEWLTIWQESGHLHERGRKKGQYCMARFGDKGAYVVGNVKIILGAENQLEGWNNPDTRASRSAKVSAIHSGKKMSPEAIEKMSKVKLGKKHSPETREKMRLAHSRENLTPETIEKMRVSHLRENLSPEARENICKAQLGRKHSSETIEKMKIAQQRRWAREKFL